MQLGYDVRMTARTTALLALCFIAIQAIVLYFYGQPAICECGYIKIWENVVLSPGNSQHIADWYTFSHIIHGIAFFYLLSWLFPRMPLSTRFLMALGIEVGWELLENTPMVIDHYRQQALAQGYIGDSILNSVSDSVAMILGFLYAARFKGWAAIALVVGFELFTMYMIRDGLILNIIGLVHPFPAITAWQASAGIQ